MNNNIITLAKFLSRYLGVSGKNVTYLTHEDVEYFFPFLIRSSFECIKKNPALVECGKVILVNDGHKTIPYYAPMVSLDYETNNLECEKDKDKIMEAPYDYAAMKIYELRKLLNIRLNGYHTSRYARRELEDRGVVLHKKYNRREFKNWRNEDERD